MGKTRRFKVATLSLVVVIVGCGSPATSPGPASSTAGPTVTATPGTTPAASATPQTAALPWDEADDVEMFKRNPGRTGEYAGVLPTDGRFESLWAVQTNQDLHTTPVVVDGVAFEVGGDHTVVAVDLHSGAVRWTSATNLYSGAPASHGDLLIVAGLDGSLTGMSLADGTVAWTADAGAAGFSWPLIMDGLALVGGDDGRVRALDAATGTERWTSEPPAAGGFPRGASASDGLVFIGSTDGTFHAFSAETGVETWSLATTAGSFGTSAVRDGIVYANAISDETSELYALDALTGKLRWRFQPDDGSAMGPPSVDGTAVYVGTSTGKVIALAPRDGSILWAVPTSVSDTNNAITVGTEALIVHGTTSAAGLSRSDGSERWTAEFGGRSESPVVVSEGRLLVGMMDGNLMALGSPDLSLVGATPSAAAPSADPSALAGVTHVGSFEAAPGGLTRPSEIALAPDGRIWVGDGDANGFIVYDENGAFVERWGAKGSGDAQFDFRRSSSTYPWGGITFASDGGFYVADSGNFRVQAFDAARHWVRSIGRFGDGDGEFLDPINTALGPDGRLYVVDDVRDDVQVFSPAGDYERTIGSHGSGPGQINNASGSIVVDDRLYVGDIDNFRIDVFGTDGSVRSPIVPSGLEAPMFFEATADNIYLSDGVGRIYAFTLDGSPTATWSLEGSPMDLLVFGDGRVVATDFETGGVEIYRLP